MREHEVPTHVQAEDKVLLWFTFPQIVAVTAVCALSYGAYRLRPRGVYGGTGGAGRRPGPGGHRHDRGEDRGPWAAAGGSGPAEVPAGGAALRWDLGPSGAERAPRAATERIGPAAAAGPACGARHSPAAQGPGAPQWADAPPSPRLARQVEGAQGCGEHQGQCGQPAGRDAGGQAPEDPEGLAGRGGRRRGCGGGWPFPSRRRWPGDPGTRRAGGWTRSSSSPWSRSPGGGSSSRD